MSRTSFQAMDVIDISLEHLSQMLIVTPLVNVPPTGLISLRYVWYADDPAGGEYQVLQGHVPIFRSKDHVEAMKVMYEPGEYLKVSS